VRPVRTRGGGPHHEAGGDAPSGVAMATDTTIHATVMSAGLPEAETA